MKTRFISTLAIVLLLVSVSKAELVTNSIVVDGIEYFIQADKDTYSLGENVDVLFKVTNLGNEVLRIDTSYPIMDIIIYEKVGDVFNEIWNWSWDQIYPHGPVIFELDPDEFVELNGIWPQIDLNDSLNPQDHTQVPPGPFRVSGYLNPTDTDVAIDVNIIPEPATIFLLCLGGMFMRGFK